MQNKTQLAHKYSLPFPNEYLYPLPEHFELELVDTLEATGFDVGSTLVPSTRAAVVGANGTVALSVPPLSVVQATLHFGLNL